MAAGIAVALLGVYLVAVAAAALIAWLVAVIARQSQARPPGTRPQVTSAPAAPAAPPPRSPFREVIPVDRTVFEDSLAEEVAALRVFAAWAAGIPGVPRDVDRLVQSLAIRRRSIGRMNTLVERRRLVWREAPSAARHRVGAAPFDPATLDPWNPPDDVELASRHVASCDACTGQGRTPCDACQGTARVACDACGGAGKVHGVTASGAQRLLNCKGCRGKGDIACAVCSRGRIACAICHGQKRVERWLEPETSRREDVQVEPDGAVTRAYAWGADGVQASRLEIERDAWILGEISMPHELTRDELALAAPSDWLDANLAALSPRLAPGERVVSQGFSLLDVPSIDVTYGVGDDTETIELHGLRMLAPPIADERLLRDRARSLRRLGIAMAAAPATAAIFYAARGAYFHSGAVLGLIGAVAALAAVVYGAVWSATLGRAARQWVSLAILPAAAAAVLAIAAEPTAGLARRRLEAGQLDEAERELDALGSPDQPERAELWTELAVRRTLAETDADRAIERLRSVGPAASRGAAARAHVDRLLVTVASASLATGSLDVTRRRLAQLSDAAAKSPEAVALAGRLVLADGAVCLERGDWTCATGAAERARALDLARESAALDRSIAAHLLTRAEERLAAAEVESTLATRVAIQRDALELWARYRALAPGQDPPRLAALRARHVEDATALAKQIEIERRRQAAADEREAARQAAEEKKQRAAEAREERRRQAQERRDAWSSQSLLCCDGTDSPTCTCGESRRGCCSHHGGVCGGC